MKIWCRLGMGWSFKNVERNFARVLLELDENEMGRSGFRLYRQVAS
jgi:hypothetical protein